jgi:hypothetical protein
MSEQAMLREENRKIVEQMRIEEQKKINEIQQKMLIEQSEI